MSCKKGYYSPSMKFILWADLLIRTLLSIPLKTFVLRLQIRCLWCSGGSFRPVTLVVLFEMTHIISSIVLRNVWQTYIPGNWNVLSAFFVQCSIVVVLNRGPRKEPLNLHHTHYIKCGFKAWVIQGRPKIEKSGEYSVDGPAIHAPLLWLFAN